MWSISMVLAKVPIDRPHKNTLLLPHIPKNDKESPCSPRLSMPSSNQGPPPQWWKDLQPEDHNSESAVRGLLSELFGPAESLQPRKGIIRTKDLPWDQQCSPCMVPHKRLTYKIIWCKPLWSNSGVTLVVELQMLLSNQSSTPPKNPSSTCLLKNSQATGLMVSLHSSEQRYRSGCHTCLSSQNKLKIFQTYCKISGWKSLL